jgi:hypothetical protein
MGCVLGIFMSPLACFQSGLLLSPFLENMASAGGNPHWSLDWTRGWRSSWNRVTNGWPVLLCLTVVSQRPQGVLWISFSQLLPFFRQSF